MREVGCGEITYRFWLLARATGVCGTFRGNICRLKWSVVLYMSKTRLAIGTSLVALTFGTIGAGTAYAYQEHMFAARNDLQQAANDLQQAEHDKGGHREAAMGLVQQAIDQVNQGIQVGADQPGWAPPP
jgi:hypothetical protein